MPLMRFLVSSAFAHYCASLRALLLDRNWRLAVNQNLTAPLDVATRPTHALADGLPLSSARPCFVGLKDDVASIGRES
jgi:hypothetical protein